MNDLLDIQRRLTSVVGPSGYEDRRREIIEAMVRPYVDEVFTDAMGNLFAHRKGQGKRIMVAAHMDTLGFVAERVDERGFVKVFSIGGMDVSRLAATRVMFETGVTGVLVPEQKAEIGKKTPSAVTISDFYVDIGVSSREEALKAVPIGTRAAYDVEPAFMGGNTIVSSYCDDLMGCASIIKALGDTNERANDMYYVFTVQEEVGCRGAQVAANRLAPDFGIAVEVVGIDDEPSDRTEPPLLEMGKGPVLRAFDKATIYDPGLLRSLQRLSSELGIAYQTKYSAGGSNDAASIQKAGLGASVASLCFPTRYIHSQLEMVDLTDVEGVSRILATVAAAPMGM